MSKSRNNSIFLSATASETEQLVKRATTDAERVITYEPERRPQVANLLLLISLCTGESPEAIAASICDGGGGALKKRLTDALNETLAPIRRRRLELEADATHVVQSTLRAGCARANELADITLREMRRAMNMDYGL
jgi:tryptophanyl-tRNA synthetase